MKHCVIYARVASDQVERRQDSLMGQVKQLKKFAKQRNLTVKQVFMDSGSGLNQNRPALSHLLQEVEYGRVKNILCRDFTRITRRLCDWSKIDQLLKNRGVKVMTP
ncbi:MAG: recombinase family protein [Candidatus Levybacteria bacterium]|nr:recombinase family protein [Candidatus Levybacteria bacterium]